MSGSRLLPSSPPDIMPPDLAAELETVAGRVRGRLRNMTANVIEIGRELGAVKKRLKHGQFLDWVETACGLSRRMAQLMMKAALWAEGKSETVTHLEPTTVYLLAAPSTPETVVDTILSRVDVGEVIPPHVVKGMIRANKQAQGKDDAGSTSAETRRARQATSQPDRADEAGVNLFDALMAAWTSADEGARTAFLQQIGATLMPRVEVPSQIETNAGPPSADPSNSLSEPPSSEDKSGASLESDCPSDVEAETDRLIEIFNQLPPNTQKWAREWAVHGAPLEDTSSEVIRRTEARAPFRAAYPETSPRSHAAFLNYLKGRPAYV